MSADSPYRVPGINEDGSMSFDTLLKFLDALNGLTPATAGNPYLGITRVDYTHDRSNKRSMHNTDHGRKSGLRL